MENPHQHLGRNHNSYNAKKLGKIYLKAIINVFHDSITVSTNTAMKRFPKRMTYAVVTI